MPVPEKHRSWLMPNFHNSPYAYRSNSHRASQRCGTSLQRGKEGMKHEGPGTQIVALIRAWGSCEGHCKKWEWGLFKAMHDPVEPVGQASSRQAGGRSSSRSSAHPFWEWRIRSRSLTPCLLSLVWWEPAGEDCIFPKGGRGSASK